MTDKNDGWNEVAGGGSGAPAWDYKLEDTIEGVYTSMKSGIGPNKSNMYMLNTKNGERGVWGTSQLDNAFPNIPLGNAVKLIYEGKKKNPKSGRSFHSFKIYTKAVTK